MIEEPDRVAKRCRFILKYILFIYVLVHKYNPVEAHRYSIVT